MPLSSIWKRHSPRRRRQSLVVESLECRRMLTEPDETMATATPVVVDPGALSEGPPPPFIFEFLGDGPDSSDVDLYQFTGYDGFTLTATTSHGFDSTNTVLRLFDFTGAELAINDDHLSGPFSQLTYTFEFTGTYYIGVSGAPDLAYDPSTGLGVTISATGGYDLQLWQAIDEQELVITPDAFGSRLNTLFPSEAVDFFFQATQSGTATLFIEAYPGSDIQFDVQVFDTNGSLLPVSDTDPSPERFVVTFTTGVNDVFHVRVTNQSVTDPLLVLTQVSYSQVPPADDVGDTDGTARVITLPAVGTPHIESGVIGHAGDVDVFTFTVTETGTYFIDAFPASANGLDTTLEFLSPQRGLESQALSPTVNSHKFVNLIAGETVILRVKGFSISRGDYQLMIDRVQATEVTLNGNNRATFSDTLSASDPHVYRLVAQGNGILDLNMISGGATFAMVLPLGDFDQVQLYDTLLVQPGQSVFLMAFPGSEMNYSAVLQFSPLITPTFNADGLAIVTGNLLDQLDSAAYTFTAPADGFIWLELDSGFDGGLEIIEEFPPDEDFGFLIRPMEAGETGYLLVKSDSGFGNYSITAHFTTGADDFTDDSRFAPTLGLDSEGAAATTGSIQTVLDVDLFSFVADRDATYRISVSAADGSALDTFLAVYGFPVTLMDFNDDSEFSTDSLIAIDLVAGQRIFLEVSGAFPTTGAYELEIRPITDDFDDTTDAAESLNVVANNTFVQSGEIELPGDVDVFEIVAPLTGRMTLQLNAAGSLLDPCLVVYDEGGAEIAEDDDSGAELNSLIVLNVTAGQRLFVEASAFGESIGTYELRVLVDTRSLVPSGVTVEPNVPLVVDGDIETPFTSDLYTFRITVDGVLIVAQNATVGSAAGSSDLDPLVKGFINGQYVSEDDDSGPGLDALIVMAVRAGDEVSIEAGAFPGDSGAYTLEILLSSQTIIDDVPFDAVETLATADADVPIRTGAIEIPQDSDLYRLVVPAGVAPGTLLRIRNIAGAGNLDPMLEVYLGDPRDDGELIAENDDDGFSLNSDLVIAVQPHQELYIRARGFGLSTGAYTLRLEFAADDHPNTQDADPLQTLTPGNTGVVHFDAVINVPGDVDVFRFTADQSTLVRLRQTATSGVDPLLRVYNAEGELIAENDDSGNALNSLVEVEYVVGTELFVIAGAYGISSGAYTVSAELIFGTNDDTGNSFASATTLNVASGSGVVQRALETTSDVDMFRFIAPGDGVTTITIAGRPGASLTVFERLPSTGSTAQAPQQIARGTAGAPMIVAVKPGREYFVRVTGTTAGTYTLRASFAAAPPVAELLSDEEFDALLAVARQAAASSGGDLDFVMEQVMLEFQRITAGRNVNGTLVAVLDPVDFLVSPAGQQANVGFATGEGRLVEVPRARLSADDTLELVVLPASANAFNFQLHGVGADFRMAARLVTPAGIASPRIVDGSLTGSLAKNSVLQVALDFGERPTIVSVPPPAVAAGFTASFISIGTAVETAAIVAALISELPFVPPEPELPDTKSEDREDRSEAEQHADAGTDETPGETSPSKSGVFAVLSDVIESLLPRLRSLTGTDMTLPEQGESLEAFFGPFWDSVESWASQWSQSGGVLPVPEETGDDGEVPEPVPVDEDPTALIPADLAPAAVDAVFAQYAA